MRRRGVADETPLMMRVRASPLYSTMPLAITQLVGFASSS